MEAISIRKELTKMSLEELWKLFPIFLIKHSDNWQFYYNEIESLIKDILSDYPVDRITHIGSTAIKNIWSKNIIDVMIEISKSIDMRKIARIMEQNGFIEMSTRINRISLNKGYTKKGFSEKVYHVHLRYTGDNDELYFRDYLNEYQDIAKEYEKLKLKLWKKYEYNRDAYTNAKTSFISKWTQEARKKYINRYGV